jgi:hypothetical protein
VSTDSGQLAFGCAVPGPGIGPVQSGAFELCSKVLQIQFGWLAVLCAM